MGYTMIASQDGRIAILTPAKNIARTTNGEQFVTRDLALAEESLDYLNQKVVPMGKRIGSHRVKSTWGTI